MTESVEVPGWLAAHARRFYADGVTPAVPRPAATVMLLRPAGQVDGRPGYQVYLIRRAATMAFASGVYAYPGGGVDHRDVEVDVDWAGPPPDAWAAALGLPAPQARAVVCAAVREVFEETGVLLAGDLPGAAATAGTGRACGDPGEGAGTGRACGAPADAAAATGVAELEAERAALVAGELSLAELLRGLGLPLRSDLLAPWARWITPEVEPRRYDTWFFLARLPAGQRTRDVSGEADHTAWLRPDEADGLAMLPPTRVTLAQLAGYPTIDAAMAARRDAATPVVPHVEFGPDRARLVIPPVPGTR